MRQAKMNPDNSMFLTIAATLALAMTTLAGDSTVDNLTVNKNGTFYGSLRQVKLNASAPTNGLLFYFSLNSSNVPVADDSGNGNTGTVVGATWTANGIAGGAYSFNGTNNKITLLDQDCWDFTNDFTISMWVNFNAFVSWSAGAFIAHDAGSGNNRKWIFAYDGSETIFHINNETNGYVGTNLLSGTWTATTNTWYFMSVTRSSTNYSFYNNATLNGNVVCTRAILNAATPLTIGYGEGSGSFSGVIDEVRVYNRALSASEITALYYPSGNSVRFESGVSYSYPLGDVTMGVYTNGQ